MNLDQLEKIRCYELDLAVSEFTEDAVVLEIGAGAGFQAKRLAELGYSVCAIDISQSNYRKYRVWPVEEYNGRDIPYPDNYFDIVFSSNVLEHIREIKLFQTEMQRVLKPQGFAVHIVPTSSWRIWTSVAHYPYLLKVACKVTVDQFRRRTSESSPSLNGVICLSKMLALRNVLLPHRHGERGNFVSELFFFSPFYWTGLFKNHGWEIQKSYPSSLIYTGYSILGERLSFRLRSILSKVCGSACQIFVLSAEKKSK